MATQTELFGDLRPAGRPRPHVRQPPVGIEAPLWTIDKSRLIDEYIHHFLLVTKHGVYLDLFAGPQHATDAENWSVRRVLERRTEGNPSIRHYAVCDIKRKQADRLRNLGRNHPSFRVYEGDANERVHEMLEGAPTPHDEEWEVMGSSRPDFAAPAGSFPRPESNTQRHEGHPMAEGMTGPGPDPTHPASLRRT